MKTLFHITQYGNLHSIKKHGLIDNLHDGIFATDDDLTSLNWMRTYYPKSKKFLCCSFQVEDNDPKLWVSTENMMLQILGSDAQVYMYHDNIHPSRLTLEVVEINREGLEEFYEVENTIPYQEPSKSLKQQIMRSSLKALTTGGSEKIKDKLLNYEAWYVYCEQGLAREDFLVKNGYKEPQKNLINF